MTEVCPYMKLRIALEKILKAEKSGIEVMHVTSHNAELLGSL